MHSRPNVSGGGGSIAGGVFGGGVGVGGGGGGSGCGVGGELWW